jgi:uncharacterized protein (DUF1499 family)
MTATGPGLAARLAWLALGVALFCALAELLAGPGYRLAWWPLGAGLQIIRWSASVALGAVVVAAVLAVAAGGSARRVALAGLVAAVAVAGPPVWMWWQARSLPRIHDISTDTERPPSFVAVVPLRVGARNGVDYVAATAAEQKKGYPDIGPLVLNLAPMRAFANAERVAHAMGWEVVASSPITLRLEATDTSLLFGFKDDIVVRVTPVPNGSRVDLRSLSRVGGSDFGVNAQRVRKFLKNLAAA